MNILDVILLSGVSIGIFISSVLLFIKKQNTKANRILSVIVLLSVIMLLGRLFFIRFFENVFLFRLGTTVDGTVFLFGPLVLYFFKNLLFEHTHTTKLMWWYFIPFLIYLCFAVYTYTFDMETYYQMVMSNTFRTFYLFIEILGILTNVFFIYHSFLTLQAYRKKVREHLSFGQSISTFAHFFILSYTLCICLWVIGFISNYFFQYHSKIFNYDTVWISIPAFIYLVGFYALSQPEIFRVPHKSAIKNHDRIPDDKVHLLKTKLEHILREQKLFYDSNLSLTDLSEALQSSNNDVSWLINNIYKTNFYQFVNRFRIEEFINRIRKGHLDTHTISAISIDVGFNSKSTFYKSFKLFTNTTPNNYIKRLPVKK